MTKIIKKTKKDKMEMISNNRTKRLRIFIITVKKSCTEGMSLQTMSKKGIETSVSLILLTELLLNNLILRAKSMKKTNKVSTKMMKWNILTILICIIALIKQTITSLKSNLNCKTLGRQINS